MKPSRGQFDRENDVSVGEKNGLEKERAAMHLLPGITFLRGGSLLRDVTEDK